MTDRTDTLLSPSKITDYFPPSPKSQSSKDKDSLDGKSELGKDIVSSSVLLTPESSPAKDNTKENKTSQLSNSHSETTSQLSNSHSETTSQLSNSHSETTSQLSNSHSENQCSPDGQTENKRTDDNVQDENNDCNESPDTNGQYICKKLVVKDSCSEKQRNDASSPIDDVRQGDESESDSSQDQPKPSKPKQIHVDKTEGSKQKKGKGKSKVSQTTGKPPSTTSVKSRKKKAEPSNGVENTLLTDFYPVRRSYRRTQSQIEKEKQQDLEDKILYKKEEGLEVQDIDGKGRGVVATKAFYRGDFVVEYAGDLIDISTAKKREEKYSKDPSFGCYMYYFVHKNKSYCVDATAESGHLGRLINHSKVAGNCHTKLIDINQRPYLILVASRDISAGEELLYDYGDRSKASLESHPWLKS